MNSKYDIRGSWVGNESGPQPLNAIIAIVTVVIIVVIIIIIIIGSVQSGQVKTLECYPATLRQAYYQHLSSSPTRAVSVPYQTAEPAGVRERPDPPHICFRLINCSFCVAARGMQNVIITRIIDSN